MWIFGPYFPRGLGPHGFKAFEVILLWRNGPAMGYEP